MLWYALVVVFSTLTLNQSRGPHCLLHDNRLLAGLTEGLGEEGELEVVAFVEQH